MIAPDYHPHTDDLAMLLAQRFGDRAYEVLHTLKLINGNTPFMQVMEALCFLHETTEHDNEREEHRREGARRFCLRVHAARTLTEENLKGYLDAARSNTDTSSAVAG